jgi:hypothetical protein
VTGGSDFNHAYLPEGDDRVGGTREAAAALRIGERSALNAAARPPMPTPIRKFDGPRGPDCRRMVTTPLSAWYNGAQDRERTASDSRFKTIKPPLKPPYLRSEQRVRLSRTRLAVGEDADIASSKHLVYERGYELSIDLALCCRLAKDVVKSKEALRTPESHCEKMIASRRVRNARPAPCVDDF